MSHVKSKRRALAGSRVASSPDAKAHPPGATKQLAVKAFAAATLTLAAVGLAALLTRPPVNDSPPQQERPAAAVVRIEKPARPPAQHPADVDPSPQQARIQQQAQAAREQAFDTAEQLFEAFPDDPQALHVLANVHQRHRNEPAAVQLWEHCLKLDPESTDALTALGRLALIKADYPQAEEKFRRALASDPNSSAAPVPLAEALISQGNSAQAVGVLESFLSTHPESLEGWAHLGQAYAQLQDHPQAKRCHLQTIALDPDYVQAYHGAATALQALGEAEEAERYFQQFRQLQAELPARFRQQDVEQGEQQRVQLTLTSTYTMAALVYARHGQLKVAEQLWKRAAEVDPEHVESRDLLIDLYLRSNRREQALELCRQLAQADPENGTIWASVGVLAVRLRRLEEAEQALRRAIALEPGRAENYAVLAQVQMPQDRNPSEAVELAMQAVELQASAGHHYILATAWWNTGELAKARQAIQQAINLDPANAEYHEALLHLQEEP